LLLEDVAAPATWERAKPIIEPIAKRQYMTIPIGGATTLKSPSGSLSKRLAQSLCQKRLILLKQY